MVDRVPASIELGGALTARQYAELTGIIADEDLSTEWDGELFESTHRTVGASLRLYAHEVSCGRFAALEAWCAENKVPFVRWSGAFPGESGAERVVFTGEHELASYAADEDDYVVIGRGTVEHLGSFEAIIGFFDAADFNVPPLMVEGDLPDPRPINL